MKYNHYTNATRPLFEAMYVALLCVQLYSIAIHAKSFSFQPNKVKSPKTAVD